MVQYRLKLLQDNSEIEKKILDHDHNKEYNTTREFTYLTEDNFAARLKQAKLAARADIADFVKRQILMIN